MCYMLDRCEQKVSVVILPKDRDPRFVTIRRGGPLTDSDYQLLALWAASCAEHVLDLFESARPEDPRSRQAIEQARAWMRGEITMSRGRAPRPSARVRMPRCRLSRLGPARRSRAVPARHWSRQPRGRTSRRQ